MNATPEPAVSSRQAVFPQQPASGLRLTAIPNPVRLVGDPVRLGTTAPPVLGDPPRSPQGPQLPQAMGDPDTLTVLPDLAISGFTWYLPTFELVAPTPGAAAPGAPFGYSFVVSGHDQHDDPIIDARITVTLRAAPPDPNRARITDPSQCAQVVLDRVDALLIVPYRDAATGNLVTNTLAANPISVSGDTYTLVFAVTGDLARAAYGSLARAGYQSVPTRLEVRFSFTGYTPQPVQITVCPVGTLPIFSRPRPAPVESPPIAALPPQAALADRSGLMSAGPLSARAVMPDGNQPAAQAPAGWSPMSVGQSQSLDVFVPCSDFGGLYVDTTDPAHPAAIGCQDTMALGRLPNRLYTALDQLTTPDYQVFAAVSRPAVYLVVPRRYRVGRAAPGHPGVPDWTPLIRWIQVFDATHDATSPCRLQASLQPDLTAAQWTALKSALAARTPNPSLLLPTSFGSGATGFTVSAWNAAYAVQAALDGDSVALNIDTGYTDAVILNGMLGADAPEGRLVGNASFALSDGTTLGQIELHADVTRLAGPWPDGPVTAAAAAAGTAAAVQNHAENQATVTRLLAALPDGSCEVLADGLGLVLPAGAAGNVASGVPIPAGARLVADYTLADSTPAVVAQERVYVEDLHTTVSVVNDAKLAAAGISGVDVRARLDGDSQSFTFSLGPATPLFQFDLVEPLVADRQAVSGLLHLGATVHRAGQPDTVTGDYIADLHKGVILYLSAVLAA